VAGSKAVLAEYAISTNLISWVPAKVGIFGWPMDGPEAEVVEAMRPGDLLIPKFSQTPDYRRSGGHQTEYVKAICDLLELDYDEELADYEKWVAGGAGAVPFIWGVTGTLPPDARFPSAEPWSVVTIDPQIFTNPYSTSEFLRLRALPIEIARQFKATAAPGRHIQRLPDGTGGELFRWSSGERGDEALRKLLLVRAPGIGDAFRAIVETGMEPRAGDYLFLVGEDLMLGFCRIDEVPDSNSFRLIPEGEPIAHSPEELMELFERAAERILPRDGFRPGNAVRASNQLAKFLDSGEPIWELDEFGTFYDRFVLLPQKVSQASEIAEREDVLVRPGRWVIDPAGDEDEEGEDSEQDEQDRLHGLTIAAVEKHLDGIVLPPAVLAEAVTAIRAGKHLLLSGPPGTGKSVIAAALCRAVVDDEFQTATATADWTTFDTIGGYMPQAGGGLEFEPGIVLRCLEPGRWLIVDELNRADIDKAFGPLFTLLSSSGEANGSEDVTLPFRKSEKSIRIVWSQRRENASSPYALTPAWRLIGTLNVRDKASLFQLSFAFMRRFAVVDVPLPPQPAYERLFESWVRKVEEGPRGELIEAAMRLAFGPRQLGPAILKDIAAFVSIGMTTTETASARSVYGDPVEAFLAALRLYAAPQYEGASRTEIEDLLRRLRGVWAEPPEGPWGALERALGDVGLE
jgi:MoxR-like ATPase